MMKTVRVLALAALSPLAMAEPFSYKGNLSDTTSLGLNGFYTTQTGTGTAVAPVDLPDGAFVTKMTAYVIDDALGSFTLSLSRNQHGSTGFAGSVASVTTLGISGNQALVDTTNYRIDHSVESDHLRAVSTSWSGNQDMRILSVVIEYIMDRPR